MTNTALNRTGVSVLTNKSGGSVAQGDVVIIDTANANAFTTTTTSAFVNGLIGVVLEPNGIANNASGLVAFGIWIPKLVLNTAATIGQFIKHHSVAKQGTPHSAPMVAGDFAIALEASATPKALLFGSIFQGGGGGTKFISETTVSSGASLAITSGINSTYDEYEVHFHIAPATDNVAWRIELSTDGGSSWLSSNYKWSGGVWYSNGFSASESNNGASIYSVGECGNASGEHVRGIIRLLNPGDTSYQKMIKVETTEISHQPYLLSREHALQNTTLSAVNAIRFTFGSGNVADGRARLYGIAKS